MAVLELRPYQKEAARFLAERKTALLADEMGLGKTASTIAAIRDLDALTVAVVCPASVREVWPREFEKFWPMFDRMFLSVASYEQIPKLRVPPGKFDVLVLDEAHYLKNAKARRTQAVYGKEGLIGKARRVYALSGTPMPNNPGELWPTLRALAPETILGKKGKPMAYWPFVHKYCRVKDNGFGLQILGAKNHDKLNAALRPFMLRRLKRDVAGDLPPISFADLPVAGQLPALPEHEHTAVAYACNNLTDDDVLAALRKQAPHVASLRRLTALAKVPGVVEWVSEWLGAVDRQIVLFAHHREVIDAIYDALKTKHAVGRITGGTPAGVRGQVVDAFQAGKVRVFVGQIQAAGTGITLTAASDVVFVEASWTPADNAQAAMRVHRIGQDLPCLVRFAVLPGSIDDRVAAVLRRKTADITKVLD